jgi:tetratricopeptide (TPR) repeat protein
MISVTQSADALIAKVKTREAEAKQFKLDGDHQDAIDVLREAIHLIEQSGWRERVDSMETVTDEERRVAEHLAECYGMMGGIYRALPNGLKSAVECFASGRKYEADLRFKIQSSYNLVNELILPIEMGLTTSESLRPDFERAVSVLKHQVADTGRLDDLRATRRLDRWAWADLGECHLLAGNLTEAIKSYQRFTELAEPRQIRSARVVLEQLAEVMLSREPEAAERVRQAVEHLVKPRSNQGQGKD